jgi:lactoylglutathione lyase
VRTLSTAARPFRVLGLQQVAIGGLNKGALSALWEGVLGVQKVGSYVSEKENVDEDILLLGKGAHAVELDLMQPLDSSKAPKVHVPPLNHIGIWVDDIEAAVEYLSGAGVRFAPGGIRKGASGHNVTFIHPKGNDAMPLSGEGVLLELVQAPPEVIAAHAE